MALRRTLLVAAALAAGCATGKASTAKPLPPPARESRAGTPNTGAGPVSVPGPAAAHVPSRPLPHDAAIHRAIETAQGLVGQREIVVDGVRYGDGCAALVRAAFEEAGHPLPPSVTDVAALHALARKEGALRKGKPAAGDLVFLSDRPGGLPEHVGMVERVAESGTVTVLHRTGRGVARLRVNPAQPWKARGDDGRILNDVLVVGGGRVPVGRLLVAFASLL